jgi:type IV fimbrial biogenesis protein FimT
MSSSEKFRHPFIRLSVPSVCLQRPLMNPLVGRLYPSIGPATFSRGFTMVELAITLTVAAILLAVAAPSVSGFFSTNRLASQINDFAGALSTARSEAVTRRTSAGVCASNGGTSCAAGAWGNGWLVFYVCPAADTTCVAGTNVPVATHEALTGGNTLTGAASTILYANTGEVTAGGNATYTLCDPRYHKTRTINITKTGRSSIAQGTC